MLPVFMYHHVCQSLPRVSSRSLLVSPEHFAKQMSFLSQKGFRCLSLSEVVANWKENKCKPGHSFALTFDDAYADICENALPLLKNLGYSATIFVVVQPIEEGNTRYLSWPVMRELAQNNFTFGSHTLTHRRLSDLDSITIKRELNESKKVIEDRLGRSVDLLAYPYGDSNERIQDMACESGYHAACAVATEHLTLFNLWRVPINGHDSELTFSWKAHGGYFLYTRLLAQTHVGRKIREYKRYISGASS